MNLSEAWEAVESYGFVVRIRHNCDWVVIEAPSGERKSFSIIDFLSRASLGNEEYIKRWNDEQESKREPED